MGQGSGRQGMGGVGLWEACRAQVPFSSASFGDPSGGEKHLVSLVCSMNFAAPLLCVRRWGGSESPALGELTVWRGHKGNRPSIRNVTTSISHEVSSV